MKLRLTVVAAALSVLTVSPVFADGADGACAYGSKFKYTAVEPQDQSEAAKKLASLTLPVTGTEVASTSGKAGTSASKDAEKTTTQ
jgi:hypothetical protein